VAATVVAKRAGQRKKSVEQMVAYAISHRTRVLILITLNEGVYSPAEIANIIDEPLNKVSNHVTELAEGGSIEIVDTKMRRNTAQHFYRATQVPIYLREQVEAMTVFERQVTAGLIVQSLMAEVMASLGAGKLSDDPGVCLVWDRLNLDEQGREQVAKEQEDSWLRMQKFEEESLLRAAASGEDTVPYVAAALGFERARRAPKPSYSSNGE
jgi:DNA-binding transcriptional ArsR family regulator